MIFSSIGISECAALETVSHFIGFNIRVILMISLEFFDQGILCRLLLYRTGEKIYYIEKTRKPSKINGLEI